MSVPPRADWKVRGRRSELRRLPWLEVFRETVELPGGRLVDDFYTVEMQDFVVTAAFTSPATSSSSACTVTGRGV